MKRGGGGAAGARITAAEGRYALEPKDALDPGGSTSPLGQTLLRQAHVRLRSACVRSGKARHYDQLEPFVSGDDEGVTYRDIASALGMTEGAARVAVHRLRRKFRDLLREEIAHTVDGDAQVEEELRFLRQTLADTAS